MINNAITIKIIKTIHGCKLYIRKFKHGCNWHDFSKFHDSSLKKSNCPDKYKMSVPMWLLASTYSRPQFPVVHLHWEGFNKFSFFLKEKNRWGHGDPKCFLQHSMVLKQSCWSISIFHKFSSKWKFFRLKIQFPEECSSLDHFLTYGNPINDFIITALRSG